VSYLDGRRRTYAFAPYNAADAAQTLHFASQRHVNINARLANQLPVTARTARWLARTRRAAAAHRACCTPLPVACFLLYCHALLS